MVSRAVTLMELLVVVIIISTLAVIGVMHYGGFRQDALDREAQANLRLIQSAQSIFRVENPNAVPQYFSGNNNGLLNTGLRLFLPNGPNHHWDYTSTGNGCADATMFTGGTIPRTWRLRMGEDTFTQGVICP